MWQKSIVHLNLKHMTPYHHVHQTQNNSSRVTKVNRFEWFQESVLWKIIVLLALIYIIWNDKVSIVFGEVPAGAGMEQTEGQRVKASLFDFGHASAKLSAKAPEVMVELQPASESNLTHVMDPGFAQRNGIETEIVETRMDHCKSYVARFAPVAVAEMRRTGLPASITLAQGLLESDAGLSKLAKTTNNHFGVKCFSKKCKKGHCMNFTDDSHKDFFLHYSNVWESYRAHTDFLKNSNRYAQLFDLGAHAYRQWAKGLANAGYASDPQYANKLIAIIQQLGLDQYDLKY